MNTNDECKVCTFGPSNAVHAPVCPGCRNPNDHHAYIAPDPQTVYVFWVGEYEDAHIVGPFATEALAQSALDAYKAYPTWFLTDPSATAKVIPWTVKDEAETVALIARRRWESIDES